MPALILLGSILTLCACQSSHSTEDSNLLSQAVALEQRHCQLKASIDSLWDSTTAQLEQVLPANLPPIDRDIFLKSRNADHIRMFMSFKQLDSKSQMLVNQAGQYDEMLAAKAHRLFREKQKFEDQKILFFARIGKKRPGGQPSFRQKNPYSYYSNLSLKR